MKFAMQYRRADALEKANAECWHDIEMAPPNAVRRVQEENLIAQMAYLKENSDFYRDILAQAGIAFDDIRTIEDLQKLPYTFKIDIRESLASRKPFGRHLAADPKDVIQMQASSGTTGSPSYVALTESDVEVWNEMSTVSAPVTWCCTGFRWPKALSAVFR